MKSTITKTIKQITSSAIAVSTSALAYSTSVSASAADQIKVGSESTGQSSGGTTLEQGVETVINLLLFLIGIIAVIAIIIGGIRYTTSNGDAGQTKAAKDTILYAIVGLIVAIMAYAIVRWVVNVFM